MLARAYRFTDKFGVVIIKLSVALVDALLDGLFVLRRAALGILIGLGRVVWFVLKPILALLAAVAALFVRGTRTVGGRTVQAGGTAMARRAARSQVTTAIPEDPLRAQNRTLSGLTVVLLAVLLGVVLWATNPARTGGGNAPAPGGDLLLSAAGSELTPTPILQNTPVPTTTSLPSVLEVRGSLAYVARERGQTDIWSVPIGSRAPIRLTNDPADERDPAWSPDGRRLAYASRQDGNWELYIYDIPSGEAMRLTYDLSFQAAPSWSPDGQYLVYESYQGNNLDIYIMRVDPVESPIRLPGNSSAPDFSPSWSPEGRQIAFVSWRDGNQDIYVFSLDDQTVTNITRTPTRHEDHPVWSPDGSLIAYSALDEGLEKVFVVPVNEPNATPQVIGRGRAPAWSPDGSSLVAAVDSIDGTQLVVSPFSGAGVGTAIFSVAAGASDPTWTVAPLPQSLVNSGGLSSPVTQSLYIEQEQRLSGDPPFRLNTIGGVIVEQPILNDRVNDSFIALREAAAEHSGADFLGRLDHAFWNITRPRNAGDDPRSWLMTGRAFAIPRNAIAGFPAPIEVVREDLGVNTYWRVYVRVAEDAQSGQLGEPLRHMPWDFTSRTQGDVEAYNQGGRLKSSMPEGYYIDLTRLAQDYDWERAAAGSDWRANSNTINYWLFYKRDGLSWYEAMREIYTEAQLGGYGPTATPAPPEPEATEES